MIGGVTATSFGSQFFGEGSLEVSQGIVSGLVGVGGGSGGAYSALVTGTVQFPRISMFLSARRMHVDDDAIAIDRLDRYQPYFRTQDNIFGSVQMRALGGSVNLSGSYTRSPRLPTRHTLGLQYTRSMQIARLGTAMVTAGASKSDIDTRFGFSISLFRRVDRKTTASFTGGGQYVSETMPGEGVGASRRSPGPRSRAPSRWDRRKCSAKSASPPTPIPIRRSRACGHCRTSARPTSLRSGGRAPSATASFPISSTARAALPSAAGQ
ncbi:hypothetical protein PIB19_19395 [Sphingomonas sp. 7/4-4]|uniref:hypothetical protein n=1 Tax=Sphingomonas sp. 7/4-4 TaxID=3018446 RepID=UPI0022F3CAEB|nr:hypothetical protein [Sphingomonas sp. 7/4-4]WBY07483.1 hypothetical protein PIB19_19395 [Sphingomonas sp. 7/4-4]